MRKGLEIGQWNSQKEIYILDGEHEAESDGLGTTC